MADFILASASPRRLTLLNQAGFTSIEVLPANIDETPMREESPAIYCNRIALEKTFVIAKKHPEKVVLGGDTIATLGRRILCKPSNEEEAIKFIKLLSGRKHTVLTSICVIKGDIIRQKLVKTKVRFKRLTEEEIALHTKSNQWQGMSGGYTMSGMAGAFIVAVNGSVSSVVGLPLYEASNLLKSFGIMPYNK